MSLKQAMRISVLLLALGAIAMAGTVQLTDVGVQTHDNATTLTIKASGAFTHTAYRPADNLLLVDLSGVTADKLENQTRALRVPGVESYHVVSYKGANGMPTVRLEISLEPGAQVQPLDQATNAVMVRVIGKSTMTATSAKESVSVSTPESDQPTKTAAKPSAASASSKYTNANISTVAKSNHPVQLSHVSVSRGKDGLNVEIAASGAIAPTVFKLSGPDRVVVDVPNALPAPHQKMIAVNQSGVESIRIARYSMNPPATRIVVDLASAKDFALDTKGNHASLHLGQAPAVAAVAAAPVTMAKATETQPAATTDDGLKFVSKPATSESAAEFQAAQADIAAGKNTTSVTNNLPVTSANASMRPQPALNLSALQQPAVPGAIASNANSGTGGPACGTSASGEPISVNFKDVDIKDFFRLISDISGLNVVLDPRVSGSIPALVLNDVPWDQAMGIVLRNNGLDCQLTGNVLRIASSATLKAEADAKVAQDAALAQALETQTVTRYISYATASEMLPTIKSFLSPRGAIVVDARTNSLIITDIPTTLPRVDQMIKQLDQKTPEVEIEARVVAATRTFARDLGTQLGFAWGNGVTTVGGNGSSGGSSPLTGIPAQTGGTGASVPLYPVSGGVIPLFSGLGVGGNSGISFSNATNNYRLDFLLSMGENRGLLKILSRPRIVTQNNKQAVVKQGTQIPVVTGAQLGGPPTVQYIAAFLRLTVTPQITADGTVLMNIDLENTVPDFTNVKGNQLNPALVSQQATTSVLVTDGGTVVIGGVIQTQNNVAIAQVPLLGNIPILGNVFKQKHVTTNTQELIFFITPRIIQT